MKLLAGILFLLMVGSAGATEPVILSLYGDMRLQGNPHQQLDFTLSELQALPQAEITTSHPWSNDAHRYGGVDLNALLERLFAGQTVTQLSLEALNGFSIVLDWSRISTYRPILAWHDNGKIMNRRNQGPLWLMLPFDQASRVNQADFIHFMVWQLRTIRVTTEPE